MTRNYLKIKRKVSIHYEEGEAALKFIPSEEHFRQIFYQVVDMVVRCIRDSVIEFTRKITLKLFRQ